MLATSASRIVMKSDDDKGIRLLTCAAPTPCDEVIRLNPRIANIQPASMTLINHTSSTGAPLKAIAMKPPGYQAGKAYPTFFGLRRVGGQERERGSGVACEHETG